ncbi:MAG: ATPase [Spirulina sp. DLM2.Bin59]|nr:MAG: ATPase [Spirulina sp. DLM2.Bin59]
MTTAQALRQTLQKLDGASYGAYKSIKGRYDFGDFTLWIDHVQGDPFAAPSRVRVEVPAAVAQWPEALWANPVRRLALEDYLLRAFGRVARDLSDHRGSGKSGLIQILQVGQEAIAQTALNIDQGNLEARFTVGLPAQGRRILGRMAAALLCEDLPDLVKKSLLAAAFKLSHVTRHCETIEDNVALREQLAAQGLVAFVANGAILPRRSGVDPRPLPGGIPFQSPPELAVTLTAPNGGPMEGMGIPQGITLIVGGGYHGKSTLLQAIELGIYPHIPGDGREYVVTDERAVKIRAEDGRSVVGVNISPFINHLPQGQSTLAFSTTNASGSTSQAANLIEALEAGAKVLLVDEDTAATNFMIRDRRMQKLIAKAKEPITPLIDKIRQLWEEHGVSTLLVMGGSGDYFEVADRVIALDQFRPLDVTVEAKEIAATYPSDRTPEGSPQFGPITPRIPLPASIDPKRGKRDVNIKVQGVDGITLGTSDIDLGSVAQVVNPGQLRAIAAALVYGQNRLGSQTLPAFLDELMGAIAQQGLDAFAPYPCGDYVGFRRFELAAVLNRLRSLQLKGSQK